MPLTAFAPLVLLAAALLAINRPGPRPGTLPQLAEGAALFALALAVAGALQIAFAGPATLVLGSGALLDLLALGNDQLGEVYVLTSLTTGPNGTTGSVYRIIPLDA